MGQAAEQWADLYAELEALPENLVGEIINGRLIAHPRPAGGHGAVNSKLGMEIGPPYQMGRGGPGGWWIIDEPEVHFIRDVEVVVPDIAGWRRQRMPRPPRDHRYEVVPDWVCEILSPGTAKRDRTEKMPLYAHHGVAHLWLVDPLLKTLEAYQLSGGKWLNAGNYRDDDRIRLAPFDEIEIPLADLWLPDDQ
jgi:Uma2 family endonuclease